MSKLTNARNGMLLRNYLGNQNILSSEKVHIRQQLAAYSIVGSKVKDQQMYDEVDDDDVHYFQPFNEAEDYFLSEYKNKQVVKLNHRVNRCVGCLNKSRLMHRMKKKLLLSKKIDRDQQYQTILEAEVELGMGLLDKK